MLPDRLVGFLIVLLPLLVDPGIGAILETSLLDQIVVALAPLARRMVARARSREPSPAVL